MTNFNRAVVAFNGKTFAGITSDHFSTARVGHRKWVIIHTATGCQITDLVSLNSATAKARIEAIESAVTWAPTSDTNETLELNGFEVSEEGAHLFNQRILDAAAHISIIKE